MQSTPWCRECFGITLCWEADWDSGIQQLFFFSMPIRLEFHFSLKKKKKIHPLKVNYTFPILVAFSAISTTAFFPAVSLGERRWLFFLPFTSGEQSSEVTQPRPKLKPPGQVLNHLHPWLHPSPRSMSALTLSLCIHFCTYVWLWLCYFASWCCSDPK